MQTYGLKHALPYQHCSAYYVSHKSAKEKFIWHWQWKKKNNSLLHGIIESTKSIEELIAIHLIFGVISAGFCIKNYSRKVVEYSIVYSKWGTTTVNRSWTRHRLIVNCHSYTFFLNAHTCHLINIGFIFNNTAHIQIFQFQQIFCINKGQHFISACNNMNNYPMISSC